MHFSFLVFIAIYGSFGIVITKSECPLDSVSTCMCWKADNLWVVNCTNQWGSLSEEDILCCIDEGSGNRLGLEPEDIEIVYTADSNIQTLDLRILSNFTSLHTLNISKSNLSKIVWDNFTLPALRYLDLSDNNIRNVNQDFFVYNRSLLELNLAGNPLNCELLTWFIDWVRKAEQDGMKIPQKKNAYCHYYGSKQNAVNLSITYIWDIIDSCPLNCSCQLVIFEIIQMDCSGRHFYDFPEKIPYNTRFIHMENNAIHSFKRIMNSTAYQNVTQLYIDNNAFDFNSLKELEGIQRYLRLSLLHLSGNRITELPVHIIEPLDVDIKLGGNPWRCDCKRGTSLVNFLIDHLRKVEDVDNVTCSSDDAKHAHERVIGLTVTDMCSIESNKVHYLDVVNVIMGLLIVIVLVKLFYDWWHFKHSGQLPLGPTFIVQMWKQRRLKSDHIKLDCTKTLISQRGFNSNA